MVSTSRTGYIAITYKNHTELLINIVDSGGGRESRNRIKPDNMDIRRIKTLLRLEFNETREQELVRLCSSAVEWYDGHNQDQIPDTAAEESAIKLLKTLKGYVLPPEKIAFRRFIQLNITNLLLCEHEISILNDKYAANPELLLDSHAPGKLKTLLAEYSMFMLTRQKLT